MFSRNICTYIGIVLLFIICLLYSLLKISFWLHFPCKRKKKIYIYSDDSIEMIGHIINMCAVQIIIRLIYYYESASVEFFTFAMFIQLELLSIDKYGFRILCAVAALLNWSERRMNKKSRPLFALNAFCLACVYVCELFEFAKHLVDTCVMYL